MAALMLFIMVGREVSHEKFGSGPPSKSLHRLHTCQRRAFAWNAPVHYGLSTAADDVLRPHDSTAVGELSPPSAVSKNGCGVTAVAPVV